MSFGLIDKILEGDRRAIAKLITLVENDSPAGFEILKALHKHTGCAHIVGITGPPGVGKSCLIDKLICEYRKDDRSVGVLAVDPTSPFTGGAILGDRIRMKEHSLDNGVFIRSMGTRGSLGGLSKATGAAVKILDASGKDVVIIETIGVGQTQVDVIRYSHTSVVVMMPGLGDEIQAMKTGMYEIGDIYVVNKADKEEADRTATDIQEAVDYRLSQSVEAEPPRWKIPVIKTVALTGENVGELRRMIDNHRKYLVETKAMKRLLEKRSEAEILEAVASKFERYVRMKIVETAKFKQLVQKTASKEIDPFSAADEIMRMLSSLT